MADQLDGFEVQHPDSTAALAGAAAPVLTVVPGPVLRQMTRVGTHWGDRANTYVNAGVAGTPTSASALDFFDEAKVTTATVVSQGAKPAGNLWVIADQENTENVPGKGQLAAALAYYAKKLTSKTVSLFPISGSHLLEVNAAVDFILMQQAALKEKNLTLRALGATSALRRFDDQVLKWLRFRANTAFAVAAAGGDVQAAIAAGNTPTLVAYPGTSNHGQGVACDVSIGTPFDSKLIGLRLDKSAAVLKADATARAGGDWPWTAGGRECIPASYFAANKTIVGQWFLSPIYQWLRDNSARFGWVRGNAATELWHLEHTGTVGGTALLVAQGLTDPSVTGPNADLVSTAPALAFLGSALAAPRQLYLTAKDTYDQTQAIARAERMANTTRAEHMAEGAAESIRRSVVAAQAAAQVSGTVAAVTQPQPTSGATSAVGFNFETGLYEDGKLV